jgi:hypothetical protein
MAPLSQLEEDKITAQILEQLSKTHYACSSLTRLTNGTTNFVFRGTLTQPLPDHVRYGLEGEMATTTVKTVVVKHSTGFAALNKDLPIDVSRSVITSFSYGH